MEIEWLKEIGTNWDGNKEVGVMELAMDESSDTMWRKQQR